jgi:uracil-DNA glycosylase family 4|tara:strand:- start:10117 stop:10776 length:660 start_codon:yes stop_codon:yes gene_type:complete
MTYPHPITLDASDAPLDCPRCPRLQAFRDANRAKFPDYFNAPVPSFGPRTCRILVLGLAPGLKGANCSGRPFTGDWAGDLLYATLTKFGLAHGRYDRRIDDGVTLHDLRIANAVRCVPPENKPTTQEIKTCQTFLHAELAGLPNLRAVLALGTIAHGALLTARGLRKSHCKFEHGKIHQLPDGLLLADSYHCSRYNTNTGRLTPDMFERVFETLLAELG